jgi:hypothetical protein
MYAALGDGSLFSAGASRDTLSSGGSLTILRTSGGASGDGAQELDEDDPGKPGACISGDRTYVYV